MDESFCSPTAKTTPCGSKFAIERLPDFKRPKDILSPVLMDSLKRLSHKRTVLSIDEEMKQLWFGLIARLVTYSSKVREELRQTLNTNKRKEKTN
jgi:hypothetical protein